MMYRSYRDMRVALLEGKVTCRSIVESYLESIEKKKHCNIYLSVFTEKSLERADRLDRKKESGETLGRIFGMPIAVKDIISMKGEKLTCASRMLENYVSPYDATVIERLDEEDAIFLGKTNLDEFGMGSSNENSAFGAVKNPLNESYVSGGSSGGSAAAVAGETSLISLGTDTGGSVRQPASFCNVIGFKPTYGRISRYGIVAFASSFDQVGILGYNIEDIALVMEIIAGKDEMDSTLSSQDVPTYTKYCHDVDVSQFKIGLPKEFFTEDLNSEIKDLVLNKIKYLEKRGAEVVDISLPSISYSLETYYILTTAEASSNLARYDGVRYGHRKKHTIDLNDMYVQSRTEGFGEEVKRRILLGTYVLSSGYYDAYYRKAQQVRRVIRDEFLDAFSNVNVIACPTSPCFPFKFQERMGNPMEMYLADIYTVGVSLAGIPAVSFPSGFGKEKLPAGIQFMAKPFDENMLFMIGGLLAET